MKALWIAVSLAGLFLLNLPAEDLLKIPNNAAQELPPGVPRTVSTNGELVSIDFMFTTPAYQEAAFRLVVQEANQVALDMGLKENCPIAKDNIVHAFIAPFGYAFTETAIGNIKTTNYWYFVKRGNKFSDVTIANIDHRCREYAIRCQWPVKRFDTNAPYQLATQWLTAAKMDVQGLNRDYDVRVAVDGYWNSVEMGGLPKRRFTPLYIVSWLTKGKPHYSAGGGASVELFLPTKTLLSLSVEDSKYILRPPLVFTNLAALFPGKAEIKTNRPGKIIDIDGSTLPTDGPQAALKNAK